MKKMIAMSCYTRISLNEKRCLKNNASIYQYKKCIDSCDSLYIFFRIGIWSFCDIVCWCCKLHDNFQILNFWNKHLSLIIGKKSDFSMILFVHHLLLYTLIIQGDSKRMGKIENIPVIDLKGLFFKYEFNMTLTLR